ncbi:MAG: DUF2452 domain-containing protein [Bacteroidia bacterium]
MTEEKEFESYSGPASLSPIPLSVGSVPIKPEDKGKIRANAVEAMHHYAQQEMDMLRKQADLIMQQVREIEDRLKISEQIYQSEMRFTPVVNQIYHLYEKGDHFAISLIAPNEWGRSKTQMKHVATIRLLGDHSWQVINKSSETK